MRISHTLLGGHVNGRPDYISLVREPRINSKLSLAAIEIEKGSDLHDRIIKEGQFSLNLFSGRILNCLKLMTSLPDNKKGTDCRCTSFYGNLGIVPMLDGAPLALECRIYEVIDLEDSSVVMAEITSSWAKGLCFKNDCRPSAVEAQPIPLADTNVLGNSVPVV